MRSLTVGVTFPTTLDTGLILDCAAAGKKTRTTPRGPDRRRRRQVLRGAQVVDLLQGSRRSPMTAWREYRNLAFFQNPNLRR